MLSPVERRKLRYLLAKERQDHTSDEWECMLFGCDYKCVRCGETPQEGKSLHRDHIVPLHRDDLAPTDGIENLQPLCVKCNTSKTSEMVDYRPPEWREKFQIMAEELKRFDDEEREAWESYMGRTSTRTTPSRKE